MLPKFLLMCTFMPSLFDALALAMDDAQLLAGLMILAAAVALLAAVVISVLLIRGLLVLYRNKLSVVKQIKIENQGNTDSIFRLKAEGHKTGLAFVFLHAGNRLSPVMLPVAEKSAGKAAAPVKAGTTPQSPQKTQQANAKKTGGAVREVQKKTKETVGMGRQIGALLGAVGSFIPGSIGKGMKDKAAALQNVTQGASRVIATPDQKKLEMQGIQSQVKRMTGSRKKQEAVQPGPGRSEPAGSQQVEAALEPVRNNKNSRGNGVKMIRSEWVQTPLVRPGETINLRLQINPVSIYRAGSYRYKLSASQMVQPLSQKPELVNTTTTQGELSIRGISSLQSALYFLLLLIIVGVNGLWLVLVLRWFISTLA